MTGSAEPEAHVDPQPEQAPGDPDRGPVQDYKLKSQGTAKRTSLQR